MAEFSPNGEVPAGKAKARNPSTPLRFALMGSPMLMLSGC